MKLWHLKPIDESVEPWVYAPLIYTAFVLRAESEAVARAMASSEAKSDEMGMGTDKAWLSEDLTTCEELLPSGEAGIIISDWVGD